MQRRSSYSVAPFGRRTVHSSPPLAAADAVAAADGAAAAARALEIRKSQNNRTLDRYFEAVMSKDPEKVRAVFHPEGRIETANGDFVGIDKILGFYDKGVFRIRDFQPMPGKRYDAQDGSGIAVEIRLTGKNADNGQEIDLPVGDFFKFKGDQIECMTVYSGKGYQPKAPEPAQKKD